MQDDPFARAVARAESAEQAQADAKRHRRQEVWNSTSRTLFRTHATVFLFVNLMLVAIWATTTPGYPWFLWPLFGWGIGLAAHYSAVRDQLRPPRSYSQPAPIQAMPAPAPPPAPAPAPMPTPAAHSAPAATASTGEEIARLAKLHKSGALTDEEFTAAKAKLLR